MTGLRWWRRLPEGAILLSFAREIAVAIASLVLVLFVAARGGGAPSTDRLIPALGTLGIFGVASYAIGDARRRRPRPDRGVSVKEGSLPADSDRL